MKNYTPDDHRFHFAAWAAARASSRGLKGFSTEVAQRALKAASLDAYSKGASRLPVTADDFDAAHKDWRECVIAASKADASLTHGRAAKLVNVYFKALYLMDFGQDAHFGDADYTKRTCFDVIHPPIDRVLLTSLGRRESKHKVFWKTMRDKGWTNFCDRSYEEVIAKVRDVTNGELWRIEAYWER